MGKDRASSLDRLGDAEMGKVLSEEIKKFLDVMEVPRGLNKIGYSSSDVTSVSHQAKGVPRVLELMRPDVDCGWVYSPTTSVGSCPIIGTR